MVSHAHTSPGSQGHRRQPKGARARFRLATAARASPTAIEHWDPNHAGRRRDNDAAAASGRRVRLWAPWGVRLGDVPIRSLYRSPTRHERPSFGVFRFFGRFKITRNLDRLRNRFHILRGKLRFVRFSSNRIQIPICATSFSLRNTGSLLRKVWPSCLSLSA